MSKQLTIKELKHHSRILVHNLLRMWQLGINIPDIMDDKYRNNIDTRIYGKSKIPVFRNKPWNESFGLINT